MFWLAAGLLTLAASLAVLLPLTGKNVSRRDSGGHDVAIYRDQFAELERDRAGGLIGEGEAAEARAEIGRRLLRADSIRHLPAGGGRVSHRMVAAVAVLAVPLLSWGLYSALGSPDLPPQPLSARLEKAPENSTAEELLARAEARLAADPKDARGWSVVAPIYLRLGRFDEAANAYSTVIDLDGATADREAGLGEALAGKADGDVTAEAEAAFRRAVALEPDHPLANFQLAAALAQKGKVGEAAKAWGTMLASLPQDSPWRGVVNEAIAEAGQALGKSAGAQDVAGAAALGPTASDVTAAQSIAPADRTAMIEGMLAGLDQKLRANPRDPEGWERLVRSYMVLNRAADARAALNRGRDALGGETEDGRRLMAFAASLGLGSEAQP